MYPVNQVILGGESMFNSIEDLDSQILKMEAYKAKLLSLSKESNIKQSLLWDEIDAEVSPLTDELKRRLMQDEDYMAVYLEIQVLVQSEIINLVKSKIENSPKGKELLLNQLRIVKKLKGKIIDDTNKEMELFNKFREFSKNNPGKTYDDFLKSYKK